MLREWSDRVPGPEDKDRARRQERAIKIFALLFFTLFLLGIWASLAG